ncbi:MAG: crossover junction endodeoxyribonuclease RuvC [Vampirovibrionales bacterium]
MESMDREPIRILGIDPGLERVGFGVVSLLPCGQLVAEDWGVIKTSKKDARPKRLVDIYDAINSLLSQTQPQAVAMEQLFFFRNITTIVPVCEARGAIQMACYQAGFLPVEYTPPQIKLHITGNGRADKTEIQDMVMVLLGLDGRPQPDDAADGLAIALTHAYHVTTTTEAATSLLHA